MNEVPESSRVRAPAEAPARNDGGPERLVLHPGMEMAFRRIPAGRFRMGQRGEWDREEPVHWVEIPHDFWMAETPVTQEQFALWKHDHKNGFDGRPKNPAENLTRHDAAAYCEWVTGEFRKEIPEGMVARLPLEAEWEYACRAGTRSEYYTGDGDAALDKAGWHGANSGGETHPVGEKEANAWGLRDLHGNVWEWCEDEWDEDAYKRREDGALIVRLWDVETEHESGEDQLRVLRGGSWSNTVGDCRAAMRFGDVPGFRIWDFGFRVCLVPGPQEFKTSQSAAFRRSDEPEPAKGTAKRRKFFPKKTNTTP